MGDSLATIAPIQARTGTVNVSATYALSGTLSATFTFEYSSSSLECGTTSGTHSFTLVDVPISSASGLKISGSEVQRHVTGVQYVNDSQYCTEYCRRTTLSSLDWASATPDNTYVEVTFSRP